MSTVDTTPETLSVCECGPPGSMACQWVRRAGKWISQCLRCGGAR